jgi:hypothetical protein
MTETNLSFDDPQTNSKEGNLSFDSNGDNQGGEGKGNIDIDAILKRDQNAQTHIKTLESEAQQYRDLIAKYELELQEKRKIDDVLERIQQSNASATRNEEPTAPVVNVDELIDSARQRVMDDLTAQERAAKENENLQHAHESLRGQFGDNYKDVVKERAAELNLPLSEIDRLGKTSPTALVSLLRGQTSSMPKPSTGSVSGLPSNQGDGLEQFTKLYRENRNDFYKPEVQKEYRKAILEKAKKEGRL